MAEYTLLHKLAGDRQRLALMSSLLDPVEQSLELGCGNGSMAQTLAARVVPTGHVVASDIDLSYLGKLKAACLEVRRVDILRDESKRAPTTS